MVEALLAVRGCVCRVVSDARVECDGGDVVAVSSDVFWNKVHRPKP